MPTKKIDAIFACRAQGMTQKETANQLGLGISQIQIEHADITPLYYLPCSQPSPIRFRSRPRSCS